MNIQEKAKKFVAGGTFEVATSCGGLEWVEVDETGCHRWICDGSTIAVRRPEDGAIAYPSALHTPDTVDRRIEACMHEQQKLANRLNDVEAFACWATNCTYEGFQRLYKAFGFGEESNGYICEKWKCFRNNPLTWYLDLDKSNRDICFEINVRHSRPLPE